MTIFQINTMLNRLLAKSQNFFTLVRRLIKTLTVNSVRVVCQKEVPYRMTTNQLRYWELQESKRTNVANEGISQQNATSNASTAESRQRDSFTNQQNAGTNWFNAQVNQQNANTRDYEAQTGRLNYGVNAKNASVNAQNANTNARNANTNVGQLLVSQFNAKSNDQIGRINAASNTKNADSNRITAYTKVADSATNALGTISRETRAWLSPGSFIFGK